MFRQVIIYCTDRFRSAFYNKMERIAEYCGIINSGRCLEQFESFADFITLDQKQVSQSRFWVLEFGEGRSVPRLQSGGTDAMSQ